MKIPFFVLILIAFILSAGNKCTYGLSRHKKISARDTISSISQFSSTSREHNSRITWHRMFTHLPSDYYNFFHRSFTSRNIPTLAAFAALTGSLLFADQTGWRFNRKLYTESAAVHKVSDIAVIMGNGEYQFIGSALFTASGLLLHNETALKTGSNIAEAILSTGLFVQLLKRITGRESPIVSTENGGEWDLFPSIKEYQKHQPEFYSFPSGHLSTATAIFTVIANNYPNVKWIRPVGYSLLGILGMSLVDRGMHWYSDLPLAYFLGYSFGNIIAPVENNSGNNISKSSLEILPTISYNGLNLHMIYSF